MFSIKFTAICVLMLSCWGGFPAASPGWETRTPAGIGYNDKKAKRLALVVGNAAYAEHPLHSPANDGKAVAQALRESGFEVISGFNLTKSELEEKVSEFGSMLKLTKGIGLFYYSGHGVQVDGENFLLPTDFSINKVFRPRLISDRATSVDLILGKMELADNKFNIVILDACRDNPFAIGHKGVLTKGLADIEAPSGTFIAYATAPNRVALDGSEAALSPYTESLVTQIAKRGKTIYEIFSAVGEEVEEKTDGGQRPWFASSLRGMFCFRGCEPITDARKAGRVYFFMFIATSEPKPEEVFYASGPLQEFVAYKLSNVGLSVVSDADLTESESKIAETLLSNDKALESLPFSSWFYFMVHKLKDLPKEKGQFVSEVSFYIETSFPTSKEFESNNAKGVGRTQLEARQHALLNAGKALPDEFFNEVKENSK